MTSVSASTLAYLNTYGSTLPPSSSFTSTSGSQTAATAGATNVTISDTARALLASQDTAADFSTVTADARAALNALYQSAGVTVPVDGDGTPTIDLSDLDRRAVYAIASNSQGMFTPDEQTVAQQELQSRFDAAMKPALSAAKLLGDYSTLYKTALNYYDNMSPEEKADPNWATQRAALAQGYQQALANPNTLPGGIANDPIADFVSRAQQTDDSDSGLSQTFSDIASKARAALDQQAASATAAGRILVLNANSRAANRQLVDFSDFDNQSLSAIALNQDNKFSPDESYAAKQELSSRTRQSILTAFQQGQSNGDPLAASLGLIQQYQGMTDEERQAAGISSNFLDVAVSNYKTTSQLLSMFNQLSSSTSGNSGLSLTDYL